MKNKNIFLNTALIIGSLLSTAPNIFAKDAATTISGVSADQALEILKDGNKRFLSGEVRKDGQSKSDIQRLSTGQSPHSIVLSCSDSRVPPEEVFDQKLGEVFSVRTAGETLSPSAIASIEFAIVKLNTHLVVVMGHTNCGAVKAAVESFGGKSAGSDNLDQLVADIHPRIRASLSEKATSKDLRDESWANTKGVAKDLLLRSKIISEAVNTGKAKVVVALYDLSSGAVAYQ